MRERPRIVYMGTPHFAVAPLERLIEKGYNIAAVVTAPDKPAGRGQKESQSAIKKFAISKQIKVIQPLSLKEESFIEELKRIDADIFIVVAFRMLPQTVWSIPPKGTFNLHASLLPQYRGAAPINWAIINGETKSGVTTFMIDKDIDTGKILFSREVEILPSDNAGTLHDKLAMVGSQLVVESVEALIDDSVVMIDQTTLESEELLKKRAPKIDKELALINWHSTSTEVYNLIRGLSPYPAAFSYLTNGEKSFMVKIFESSNIPEVIQQSPGSIETDGKSYLRAHCLKGAIEIDSLQAAGKKRLGVKEFLLGLKEPSKYRFTSHKSG